MLVTMLTLVRKISTEIKQLYRTQQRRQYPKQKKVGLRYPYLQYIEQNSHEHDLPDGQVITDKGDIPLEEVTVMKVGIGIGVYVTVVPVVFGIQLWVPKSRVKECGGIAYCIVDDFI